MFSFFPSRPRPLDVLSLWIGLPLELRLFFLALLGLTGGALANYLIYTQAYFPRPIGPWVTPALEAPPRRCLDRVPLVGWVTLRREGAVHGRAFWIRPLLIELALAAALPALYWYECVYGGLLAPVAQGPVTLSLFQSWGHTLFLAHSLLLVLMTAATFIDFDEQTIPDLITVPGTLAALVFASLSLQFFLPAQVPGGIYPAPTTFDLPWMASPVKWMGRAGLWTGLAIWTGWCFALADRRLILRRGLGKAAQYFAAGLVRHPTWKLLLAIWLAGLVGVAAVWSVGGQSWLGLLTSLAGLAVGGGVVWAVRLVASSAMGVEAMGFGDVTLMAMIGAFVGWQASLVAFFLSPIAAIVIVLIQFAITREPRVPFGPYLCAGTLLTILWWDAVYNGWLAPNLMIGVELLWLCAVMLVLLGVMLFVWRLIKRAIFR